MTVDVDVDVDKKERLSPVLARLIEEIRQDRAAGVDPNAYNRMHNRHNRSGGRPWPRPEPNPKPESEDD